MDEDGVQAGDGAEGAVGRGDGELAEFDLLWGDVFDEAFGFEGGVGGFEIDVKADGREAGGDLFQGDGEVADLDLFRLPEGEA